MRNLGTRSKSLFTIDLVLYSFIFWPICYLSNEAFASVCSETKNVFKSKTKKILVDLILQFAKSIHFKISFRFQDLTIKQAEKYYIFLQEQHSNYLKFAVNYKPLPPVSSSDDATHKKHLNTINQLRKVSSVWKARAKEADRLLVESQNEKLRPSTRAARVRNKRRPIKIVSEAPNVEEKIDTVVTNRDNKESTVLFQSSVHQKIDDIQQIVQNQETESIRSTSPSFDFEIKPEDQAQLLPIPPRDSEPSHLIDSVNSNVASASIHPRTWPFSRLRKKTKSTPET